ncbi:hypothetical protein CR513_00493, partial [Mucuna pruriens]
MAYDQVDREQKLQLRELNELCLEAYENSRIYKEMVKHFRDSRILGKEFIVVEVRDTTSNRTFKVNGYQLKPYHEGPQLESKSLSLKPRPSQEPIRPKTTWHGRLKKRSHPDKR